MQVNPADFMVLFTKGLKVTGGWKVIKGVPLDTRIVTIAYDAQRGGILFVIESEEFDLVPATAVPPIQVVAMDLENRHVKLPTAKKRKKRNAKA